MNLWRLPIDEKSGKVSGRPEPVTTPSPYSGHVAISGDGRRLAYVQWVKTDRIQKIAFDPTAEKPSGAPSPLTQGSKPAFFPDPSPDGQWLTFCSFERPEDVFVMRTDGSSLRNLTDDDFVDRFPRWSPDGNWIQFMSDRSGKYQIWMIHPDGSGLRQVTYEPEGIVAGAAWSPDATRLVYNRSGDVPRILDMRKTWQEQTPQSLPPFANKHFWAYSWSPDGQVLAGTGPGAFATGHGPVASGAAVLYFLGERKYVTVVESSEHYPVWFQDSRRILVRDNDAFHVIDIHTRKHHQVLSPAGYGRFSFSPDNRTLYYGVHTSEADIWLMTLK